jgi:hypothetical protein
MIFEGHKATKMSMFVFWFVTPYGLVGRYQRFGETYCLRLQGDSMFLRSAYTYESTQRCNPEKHSHEVPYYAISSIKLAYSTRGIM